jgi:ketosteroid isomerase-like protein
MTKLISFTTIVLLAFTLFVGCTNADNSKTEESKSVFNLEEARKGMEKSTNDFREALAKGDAKTAANYYTKDAVFMPNNAPTIIGRDSIEAALAGFIKAGFTKLDVNSTWTDGSGDYLLDTEKWTMSNGKVSMIGKSLVIWKKEDGIWKMYKDMINTDTP